MWNGEYVVQDQLRREILRQAFLLAAREELGWQVRDAWLGERAGSGKETQPLDIILAAGEPNHADILSGPYPRQRRRETIPLPAAAATDHVALMETCEAMSRGQFLQILRSIVATAAAPRPKPGAAPLPDGVAEQLDQLAFMPQFAAVRAIHREIAQRGESDALLGGLIRGYSHLGLLTTGQWNPSHHVYFAGCCMHAPATARSPRSEIAAAAVASGLCRGARRAPFRRDCRFEAG